MLAGLAIRNVVLVDQLSLSFDGGLSALTGETGAGKSILLDALGLAVGGRADSALVRHGAESASVTAMFAVDPEHPVRRQIDEHGLADGDDVVVLRRVVNADGRSRAFVNDQPISVGLLRQIGAGLVEVHGQFDSQGLLNPQTHRGVLDDFAGLAVEAARTAAAWRTWRQLEEARSAAAAEAGRARAEEDYLRHAVEELEALAPQPGEESALTETRAMLMHREKLAEAIGAALDQLAGERGAERLIGGAGRALRRVADKAGGRLDGVLAALDRAGAEAADAAADLERVGSEIDLDAGELERLEERLFALRAAARKYDTDVDGLAAVRDDLARRLAMIEDSGEALAGLAKEAALAGAGYQAAAAALSDRRTAAAGRLDEAIAAELPPLKLAKARFGTMVERLPESEWSAAGIDRVVFAVATNPGAPPGPINKIASGGELARFMLALKVVLAGTSPIPTLVFDEVDSGISGAVADAVGERLARLGQRLQVLVVTHSPQVAARAAHHWRVEKRSTANGGGERAVTLVTELPAADRREEIARMLSGAVITEQARAAAESLIGQR